MWRVFYIEPNYDKENTSFRTKKSRARRKLEFPKGKKETKQTVIENSKNVFEKQIHGLKISPRKQQSPTQTNNSQKESVKNQEEHNWK